MTGPKFSPRDRFILELLPKLDGVTREDTPDGRFYRVPKDDGTSGLYPSVTTVLGRTADKRWLDRWRSRVGDVEADRVSHVARSRGKALHEALEAYVLNRDLPSMMPDIAVDVGAARRALDVGLTRVYGSEHFLYSHELRAAGTADLIGLWDAMPAVIDFKTAKDVKREDDILDYFIQATAYAWMVEERYQMPIVNVVILLMNGCAWPQKIVRPVKDYVSLVRDRFS